MLSPAQRTAVAVRGGDLQLIACAGSGKTETIARRAASLLAEGTPPGGIIAFTFTDKAGTELKERIYSRAEDLLGPEHIGKIAPMYVGTIHGWCFRLLQEKVPRFGDFEIVDENRHAAFLSREAKLLGLKELAGNRHWDGVRAWERIVDVVGNELLDESDLEVSGLLERWRCYLDLLDRYRFLSFSRVIAEAVAALADPALGPGLISPIKHLIVDEYQDINPAQERLIELLASAGAELCVVGDDDQAIYQWRGADVGNILGFRARRPGTKAVELLENRRSRPAIVEAASVFALGIESRLPKSMLATRVASPNSICLFRAETDTEEAEIVASTIERLRAEGFGFGDIAVLLRSVRGSGAPFFDAFSRFGIPYEAGGRSGLFASPAMDAIGELYAYLCGLSWRDGGFGPSHDADIALASVKLVAALHAPNGSIPEAGDIEAYVRDWKRFYEKLNTKAPDLVGDYYRFLDFLGARNRQGGFLEAGRLGGSLARFSSILADYEHAARRGRFHDEVGGAMYRAGPDRGKSYWFGLGTYLVHYAAGAYEDFAGEVEGGGSAVRILTVHQAKGLEWPVVFIPCLVEGRFPSGRTGEQGIWHFPESVLSPEKRARYEGTEADEKRLFYVAMTRARDALYCSTFARKKRAFRPSSFFLELEAREGCQDSGALGLPPREESQGRLERTAEELSFSDIALWEDCGHRYRLSKSFGFEQSLAEELGYGHAVHHALRAVAELARSRGSLPDEDEALALAREVFYAPYADAPGRERMLASVERIVAAYLAEYPQDLERSWAIERPFELHTGEGTITGRADLIVDESEDGQERLALVDYKVAGNEAYEERYEWQLRVYALAGRREGRLIDSAWLHSLKDGTRREVSLGEAELAEAERRAAAAMAAIGSAEFPPNPTQDRCHACDFRRICRHQAFDEEADE